MTAIAKGHVAQSPNEERSASLQFALATGQRLHANLRVIDFKSYEPLSAEAAVSLMVRGAAGQLSKTLAETARLLRSLGDLLLDARATAALEFADLSIEPWSDADGAAVEGVPQPLKTRTNEEIDAAIERLVDPESELVLVSKDEARETWRMLAREVRSCRDRLNAARTRRSKWEMITEGEDGRRRALKALRFGLTLAVRVSDGPQVLVFPEDPSETETALEVREALMGLRLDLLALTEETDKRPDADLSICLRDVRIRLLDLFLHRVHRELRAADRYAIQQLRARIDKWLEGLWDNSGAARELVADIRAYAELLTAVNNRELLVTHDRQVRTQVLDGLAVVETVVNLSPREAMSRFQDLLDHARTLRFRAPKLDAFLDAQIGQPRSTRALSRGVAQLREILEQVVF